MRQCPAKSSKSMTSLLQNLISSTNPLKAMVIHTSPKFLSNLRVGWICKIALSEAEKELGMLLTEEQYNEFLAAEHEKETLEKSGKAK